MRSGKWGASTVLARAAAGIMAVAALHPPPFLPRRAPLPSLLPLMAGRVWEGSETLIAFSSRMPTFPCLAHRTPTRSAPIPRSNQVYLPCRPGSFPLEQTAERKVWPRLDEERGIPAAASARGSVSNTGLVFGQDRLTCQKQYDGRPNQGGTSPCLQLAGRRRGCHPASAVWSGAMSRSSLQKPPGDHPLRPPTTQLPRTAFAAAFPC